MPRFFLSVLLLAWASDALAQEPRFVIRAIHEESDLAMANVVIQVRDYETDVVYAEERTNERGTATVQVVPLQWYVVRAVADGFTSRKETLQAPPRGTVSFPVALESMSSRLPQFNYGIVSGHVVTPEGEPLAEIIVTASPVTTGMGGGRTITARDGSFRMDLPVGAYKLSSLGSETHPDVLPIPSFFDVYGPGQIEPVVVHGRRQTAGIQLVLPRQRRFRARVTVVGDAGPVSEGHVDWRSEEGRGFSARIEPDGTANLGPLAPGGYVLWATAGPKPMRLAGTTTIQIEDRPLDDVAVNVFPGGRLAGRLVGPDGRPFRLPSGSRFRVVPNQLGSLSLSEGEDHAVEPDGTFTLSGLIGEFCLVVRGNGIRVLDITHYGVDFTQRAFSLDYGHEMDDVLIRIAAGSTVFPEALRCTH